MTSRVVGVAWMVGAAVWLGTASVGVRADALAGTLRVGLPLMPDTLDPARSDNMVTGDVMAGIYDTLFTLDPLARPPAIVPARRGGAARGLGRLPHVHDSGPARHLLHAASGVRRQAAGTGRGGFRVLDPAHPGSEAPFAGAVPAREQDRRTRRAGRRARSEQRAIDYAAPVAGLVVVDRHTLRIRLNAPDPIFPFLLASPNLAGDRARGGRGRGEHLRAASDRYRRLPGRRVHARTAAGPAPQPGLPDAALGGSADAGVARRARVAPDARPEAARLRARRVQLHARGVAGTAGAGARRTRSHHGVRARAGDPRGKAQAGTGGPRPEAGAGPVAHGAAVVLQHEATPRSAATATTGSRLRRAIQMAIDDSEYIRVLEAGNAAVREQVVPPGIEGHIAGYRNPNAFNPAAANALLDRFGYKRGARRLPPDAGRVRAGGDQSHRDLVATARKGAEFTKRMLDRIGVRTAFESAPGSRAPEADEQLPLRHGDDGLGARHSGRHQPDDNVLQQGDRGGEHELLRRRPSSTPPTRRPWSRRRARRGSNCSGPCSRGWTPTPDAAAPGGRHAAAQARPAARAVRHGQRLAAAGLVGAGP